MAGLEFEQQAFVELLSEDGLIILARCVSHSPTYQTCSEFLSGLQRSGIRQNLSEVPQAAL